MESTQGQLFEADGRGFWKPPNGVNTGSVVYSQDFLKPPEESTRGQLSHPGTGPQVGAEGVHVPSDTNERSQHKVSMFNPGRLLWTDGRSQHEVTSGQGRGLKWPTSLGGKESTRGQLFGTNERSQHEVSFSCADCL